jgi:hypothetical protein
VTTVVLARRASHAWTDIIVFASAASPKALGWLSRITAAPARRPYAKPRRPGKIGGFVTIRARGRHRARYAAMRTALNA